jgi:hypothetical protein
MLAPRRTQAERRETTRAALLDAALEQLVEGFGWVLHDRAVGRNANIDHIVVVPSGVWVIDSVPPARTHSLSPRRICCAAAMTASKPEPQSRLTTSSSQPHGARMTTASPRRANT